MNSPDFVRQVGLHSKPGSQISLAMRLHIDVILLVLLLILGCFGLSVLYSASGQSLATITRQLTFWGVAFTAMFMIAQLEVHMLKRWSPYLYVVGIILLILVPIIGVGAKGAQRWLDLPGLPRFQPSELMKIVLPMTVAWYLSEHPLPPKFKHVLVTLVLIAIPAGLIVTQPDLGTSILIAASGIFVLLLAGLSWKYIVGAASVLLISAYPIWHWGLQAYQKQRVLTLLNPESDKLGAGWNIIQSKTAIGSGGWDGKGWLSGTQSQLNFLPEGHTDFIIAVLAEEQGLFGVLTLFLIYLLIVSRGLVIAFTAQDTYSRLLAASLILTFFVYIFVNTGMVSGLLPVVGVPLPLVSQGGTSIVSLLLGFGLLMAISTEPKRMGR